MLCYVMLYCVVLCYIMLLYYIILYCIILCYIVLCCVVLCCVVLCCVVIYYIILYYIILYYIIILTSQKMDIVCMTNTASRLRNHCCYWEATILSLCTAELHVTINNVKIVNAAQKFVCCDFTSPASAKCIVVFTYSAQYRSLSGFNHNSHFLDRFSQQFSVSNFMEIRQPEAAVIVADKRTNRWTDIKVNQSRYRPGVTQRVPGS